MRKTWTDERLDDLSHRMDLGFARVDTRLDKLDARFDGLQRTLLQIGGVIVAGLVCLIATLIATQL